MSKIIQADFNGQAMRFTADGWFNATGAAEKYGKRPIDWLNQDGVREYITALADMLKCEPGSLLKTKLDIYHRDIARVRFWAGELVALQGVVV